MTSDNLQTYKIALAAARSTFEAAISRLEAIEAEEHVLRDDINRLRRTITALSAMCSESPDIDSLGITNACLEVMGSATGLMTTADVVEALNMNGFDLPPQKNVMASVHSVLSRLARAEKIERTTNSEQKTAWKGPRFGIDDIPF